MSLVTKILVEILAAFGAVVMAVAVISILARLPRRHGADHTAEPVGRHAKTKIPQAPTPANKDEQGCYNLIILDESGSMHGLEDATITGANETIGSIREASQSMPDLRQYLTVVTFSSRHGGGAVNVLHDCTPVSLAMDMATGDYAPGGMTPLYDAMGEMLTRMAAKVPENSTALVTVITDGYENASKQYTSDDIRKVVEELEKRGWAFTYIGANQDAILEAGKIGVRNAMNYDSSVEGTRKMYERERGSRFRYYDRRNSASSIEEKRAAAKEYFKDER